MKSRSMLSILMTLPLLAATVACSDSVTAPPVEDSFDFQIGHALLGAGADVTLRAEAESFVPGGAVTLVLSNGSAEEVGFNLCFHGLERRSGNDWESLDISQTCTTHLNLLSPGQSADYATSLPGNLGSGEYRFRIALYLVGQNEARDQVSDPFQVEG